MNLNLLKIKCLILGSLFLFLGSCATSKSVGSKKVKIVYRRVVVLPVFNQSKDIAAPIMIRQFVEKQVKREGYKSVMKPRDLDQFLRQMGIVDANQIDDSNIRRIGQSLKADGCIYSILRQYKQDVVRRRTIIEAEFQFWDIKTGRIWWSKRLELKKTGLYKIPLGERVTSDWSDKEIRDLMRSPAAKLPKALVKDAFKSLPSPGNIEDRIEKSLPR